MIIQTPSQNWDERVTPPKPEYIIIHYTGTKTADEARQRFCNPDPDDSIGRISPHYMIDGEGKVFQFVEESKRAWHAGKSQWKDITDMNAASIGIEIWNTGHEFDLEDFIPAQIDALIELVTDLQTRWTIPNANILGHSDIAPGRKLDPGEKFPWRKLELNGIGLMPELLDDDSEPARQLVELPSKFYQHLAEYGYRYTQDQGVLLREFRRHFVPHALHNPDLDVETCAAILSLLNQRQPS